jgi:uncharacterized membrane protein
MIKFLLIVIASIVATTGISFLRKVVFPPLTNISASNVLAFFMQPSLWAGIFFSGTVFLLYIWILSKYETSSVVPALLGINIVTVSAFSVLFFGESLTMEKIGGYAFIFSRNVAVIIMTSSSDIAAVEVYWDNHPLGSLESPFAAGTKEFYDWHAHVRDYDEGEFTQSMHEFERHAGEKVLDIGCGNGWLVCNFARNGAKITGVDLTPKAVELTQKRLKIYNRAFYRAWTAKHRQKPMALLIAHTGAGNSQILPARAFKKLFMHG